MPDVLTCFKGFDKDMKCRGFQFEVGKTYEHDGPVKACQSGFHACESPFDVWAYYGPAESRFCSVRLSGELSRHGEDTKVAAAKIELTAELSLPQIVSAGIAHLIGLCKDSLDARSSGDSAKIGSSGDLAQIGSSGYAAQIGSSGDSAKIGSSGYAAQIGSSGDLAQIGSSGYAAKIGSSGYAAQIGSSGDSAQIGATGKDAAVAVAGLNATVRAGEGGAVSLAYHDGTRTRFAVGYVGEGLKALTWYSVNAAGEFVEVQQ